jgi:hypothetical protein
MKDANENQNGVTGVYHTTGYLNIYHRDGEYHIELHVGVQCTELAYSNEDYESIKWFAEQFAIAIKRTGGDVRLYGQDSLDNGKHSHD